MPRDVAIDLSEVPPYYFIYLYQHIEKLAEKENVKTLYTVAALCNAHAFESAHPKSYVIAHMSFQGKLSPYKPNNR